MNQQRQVARDISYASSAASRGGRVLIRTVENATGRLTMIRRADGYEREVAQGRDFWQVMLERYGLSLDVVAGSLDNLPGTGPVILLANHPFGILDGLMMGHILSTLRSDFRIIANNVFRRAEDLNRIILPISYEDSRLGAQQNLQTRNDAVRFLGEGGALGIFPGGTVATSRKPFGQPLDPVWRNFTARIIAKSGATVLPVFFDGQNSRLFQLASHLHMNLRLALLIQEFRKRIDAPVRIVVGKPISPDALAEHGDDPKRMMDFLRTTTYALSPKPVKPTGYGFEFDERYRS